MSRIGKKPITIHQGIEARREGKEIIIKGQKGELRGKIPSEIKIEIKDGNIFVLPQADIKKSKALWGLTRALVFNMIKGVMEGYEKKLEIEGVGYGAELKGSVLELKVGYINPVKIPVPEGIKITVEKNVITVSGIDKELVGQAAAKIRKVKPAEPYKGKGLKYQGEVIRRKVGKRVTATAGGA